MVTSIAEQLQRSAVQTVFNTASMGMSQTRCLLTMECVRSVWLDSSFAKGVVWTSRILKVVEVLAGVVAEAGTHHPQ